MAPASPDLGRGAVLLRKDAKMDQLVNVRIIRFIVKETESPTYFILILEIIVVLCFFNAMGLGIT